MPTSTSWLQQAAENGNIKAMVTLADELLVTGNKNKALRWYYAAGSNPDALFGIARISYEAGNIKEALGWFQKAAEAGSIKAYSQLGYMYYAGEGTKSDHERAKFWYEKAAQSGDTDAMYNLAILLSPNPPTYKRKINVKKTVAWSSSIFAVLAIGLLTWNGCKSGGGGGFFDPPDNPSPLIKDAKNATTQISSNVGKVSDQMEKNSDRLTTVTNDIKKNATDGKNATPSEAKQTLAKYWDSIIGSTAELFSIRDANDKANDQLKVQKNEIDKLTGDLNTALSKQIAVEKVYKDELNRVMAINKKLEEEKKIALQKRLTTLIVLCSAGVGIFIVVAFTLHKKLGIAGAIGCGVTLGVSLLVSQVQTYLVDRPWIIGAVLLAGAAFAIYRIIILKRAQVENAKVVESVKQLLPTQTRKWFFGDGAVTGEVTKYQSNSTRNIVNHIRTKIKNANPAPPEEPAVHPLGRVLPISPV